MRRRRACSERARKAHATPIWNPRKLQRRTHLDQPQQLHLFDPKPYEIKNPPKPRPMAEGQPSGSVVILASQPTLIPDTKLRAAFARHKKGRNPDWEARMLASYMYRKSEEGKLTYDGFKGEGILV